MKSKAGRRTIAIPAPLVDLLRVHQEIEEQERITAGSPWRDHGFAFTQPNGRPLGPKADHQAWKVLLEEAGVREARLHDARHTAATMLLVLNIGTRTVMDLMGWSSSSMAALPARHQRPPPRHRQQPRRAHLGSQLRRQLRRTELDRMLDTSIWPDQKRWPGAGSNRRLSDFQFQVHLRGVLLPGILLALVPSQRHQRYQRGLELLDSSLDTVRW